MVIELQTVETLSWLIERTETPPFYRLTSMRKPSNHSDLASDPPPMGGPPSAPGTIHTKRHSAESESARNMGWVVFRWGIVPTSAVKRKSMNVFVLMSVECKYIEQIRFWVVSQFIIMLEFPTFYFFPQFYYLTIVSSLLLPHLQVKMLHKEKKTPNHRFVSFQLLLYSNL